MTTPVQLINNAGELVRCDVYSFRCRNGSHSQRVSRRVSNALFCRQELADIGRLPIEMAKFSSVLTRPIYWKCSSASDLQSRMLMTVRRIVPPWDPVAASYAGGPPTTMLGSTYVSTPPSRCAVAFIMRSRQMSNIDTKISPCF